MNRTARRTLSLPLAALTFAAIFVAAGAAHAQRWERGPDRGYGDGDPHWGPYFAAGIGGGLQLAYNDLDNQAGQLAGQAELRFGFSFSRVFQLYLDADLSGASHSFGTVSASDVMLGLRYFFYADRFVGVYARAGLGVGIVSGNSAPDDPNNTYTGIAESYGLGMEFRMGGPWSLSPEIFYRRTDETDYTRVDTLGVGLLINFN